MQEKQPGMAPMHEETIKILPFKLKRDRKFMPFKPGQGVSLAGWQFQVAACLPNGNVVLKPVGKIVTPDVEQALNEQVAKRIKEINYTGKDEKPPVYNPAEVDNAEKPNPD